MRLRDAGLTVSAWAFYVWLNRDVFHLLADALEALRSGVVSKDLGHAAEVLATLGQYAGIILFNTAILAGWALYNQMRFRGKDRRAFSPPVRPEELAELCDAATEEVELWQKARILVVTHGPEGRFAHVEIGPLFPEGGRGTPVP